MLGKQGVARPSLSAITSLALFLGSGPPGIRPIARGVSRTLAARRLEPFQAGLGWALQGLISESTAN